jgi:hypothetical protein
MWPKDRVWTLEFSGYSALSQRAWGAGAASARQPLFRALRWGPRLALKEKPTKPSRPDNYLNNLRELRREASFPYAGPCIFGVRERSRAQDKKSSAKKRFYAWEENMDRERGGSTTVNSGSKRRTSVIVTLPGGRVHCSMPVATPPDSKGPHHAFGDLRLMS